MCEATSTISSWLNCYEESREVGQVGKEQEEDSLYVDLLCLVLSSEMNGDRNSNRIVQGPSRCVCSGCSHAHDLCETHVL